MKNGINRRRFLKYSMATFIAGMSATVGTASLAAFGAVRGKSLTPPFSYHTFTNLLGQSFKLMVTEPDRKYAVKMRLEEVVSVKLKLGNDQFYIVFKVLNKKTRPNGIYQICHATAGKTRLYLQSMGDSVPGNYCRADFNLLT